MTNGRRLPWAQSPRVFLFAAGVGIIGGLVGTLFQLGSYGLQHAIIGRGGLVEAALQLPWWQALLIPCGGALAATLLTAGLTRHRQAQGMPDVMEAVSMKRAQQLRVSSTLARALSSLALIATGGSVGREGPIVYLSATFGARFARLSQLPATRMGIFAGCGIAAGMSSAYYAPFGAALFAMEVVLGNFAVDVLAPVFIASAVSSGLVAALATDGLLGDLISGPPVYVLPHFTLLHAGEYVIYVVLGFASAGAAWLFVRAMRDAERFFAWLPVPPLWKLPLAGLMLGLIGIWLPHVWGNGYHAVTLLLEDIVPPALWFVLLLFLLKIFATSITTGSGGSGGIFTPTLFVGAAMGLLVGMAGHALVPHVAHDPRTYAVVGMASVLAATTHAPIMAMILMLEMTRETDVFLPMMISSIIASVVSRGIGVESVYLSPLRRRGVVLPEGIEETALTTTRVTDIMRTEAVWIRETATFDMIVGMVEKTRRDCIYVVAASEELLGVIRIHDIKNYLADRDLGAAVIAADLTVPVPPIRPYQTLAEILEAFDDPEIHELPVVDPVSGKLLAVIDRRDLISALSVEVLQGAGLRAKFVEPEGAQHYVEMPKGHALARIPLPPDMAGRALAETNFRNRSRLTILTIVRNESGRETRLLPVPGHVFRADDALIVMGADEDIKPFAG